VGESDQFYIALKLLGKDVEYLQVAGQNHWIVDHAKRVDWSRSIVAWFDRWLKDQPEWWEDMYPEQE
jgi:dipeptidyl aminopeptidase/acylaminoacyl peptidase